jgi:hypothetical protein
VVKIPQEECISSGHGHRQAEIGSWKQEQLMQLPRSVQRDNIEESEKWVRHFITIRYTNKTGSSGNSSDS